MKKVLNKEELIGQEFKCPRCKESILVTTEGINHTCNTPKHFWIMQSLEQYFRYVKYYEQLRRNDLKFLYGEYSNQLTEEE